MAPTPLQKLSAEKTSEICALFEPSDEARALSDAGKLDSAAAPGEFLDRLIAAELYPDALRFLAYALPRREAVWWACRCVRAVADPTAELPCLERAEAWVRDPSEENRRAAMESAENVDFGTPDAWAATAAFWSDGSLAPPDAPVVPPGEELTGHAVAGAVLLAAVQDEPERAPEKYQRFAALAVDIANGRSVWDESATEDVEARG